jgi:hypothetical protein
MSTGPGGPRPYGSRERRERREPTREYSGAIGRERVGSVWIQDMMDSTKQMLCFVNAVKKKKAKMPFRCDDSHLTCHIATWTWTCTWTWTWLMGLQELPARLRATCTSVQ